MYENSTRFLLIPYEVIDASDGIDLLLPIYIYLKANENKLCSVYTSKAQMLFQSGYIYHSNSISRGQIKKVETAIEWLKIHKYIYAIVSVNVNIIYI